MRKKIIVLLLITSFNVALGQRSLIPQEIVVNTDEALNTLFLSAEKKDTSTIQKTIASISNILQPYATEYPEFTGVLQVHLGYYSTNKEGRRQWLNKAAQHLKNTDTSLAETFSANFLWLIQSFSRDNRLDEWRKVDSIYRYSLNKGKAPNQFDNAIVNYASSALALKQYALVNNLSKYEHTWIQNIPNQSSGQKINIIFAGWLQLAQQLEQWKKLSYSKQTGNQYFMNDGQEIPDFLKDKNEDSSLITFDYNLGFKKLINETESLQKELLLQNHRADNGYNEVNRRSYLYLTTTILFGYFEWAILSQNESNPLLPLKLFIWQDIGDELEDAKKHQKKPLLAAQTIVQAYKMLSILYNAVGNANYSVDVLMEGLGQIIKHKGFTDDDKLNAVELYPQFVTAYRSAGNFSKAIEANERWLTLVKKPDFPITKNNIAELDKFYNAKIEQVFTLMAMEKFKEATNLTIDIIDSISTLVANDEGILYETRSWVKLQYLTSSFASQNGKWNTELIKEMISDLMQGRSDMNILYPAHLLMLKAEWNNNKKINEEYLNNLLNYTGKQLFGNFTLLSATERMQYFSGRLQDYFDVYHELLFSKALDSYPILKQTVINQSLYLKNSLSDGNLLPDDLFATYAKSNPSFLDRLRDLRQKVIIINDKRKLFNQNTNAQVLNDQFQQLWLNALQTNKTQEQIKKSQRDFIDTLLSPHAIYIETVRYKQWLTDSSISYGAYIFEKNKPIKLIPLFSEDSLVSILKNPAASPQNAVIGNTISRGTEVLGKKTPDKKTYKTGDKDLLAELILSPLAAYLSKKEWIISNDGLLNRISFAALIYNNKYLSEIVMLRHLSSSAQLKRTPKNTTGKKILLAGDINYGSQDETNNDAFLQSNYQWSHLPGTKTETENLKKIMQEAGYIPKLLAGNHFPDSIITQLGQYSIVHLATHGFYFQSTEAGQYINQKFSAEAVKNEPLFRCGLATSQANNPLPDKNESTPGYILGYELANTDLRNCFLITLSACETGLGDLRNNMGVDGLSRALKIGGAQNLLISLWKVPDQPTAIFMQTFYTELFKSVNPAEALRKTQLKMCKQYNAAEWAAFVLVE